MVNSAIQGLLLLRLKSAQRMQHVSPKSHRKVAEPYCAFFCCVSKVRSVRSTSARNGASTRKPSTSK